jgi:hypothetical protein
MVVSRFEFTDWGGRGRWQCSSSSAHIRPYEDSGSYEATNGSLLRRDIHSLLDAGYVTITPDMKFEVIRRVREEFDNRRHSYELHGRDIAPPPPIIGRGSRKVPP